MTDVDDEIVTWVDPAGIATQLTDQPTLDTEWGVTGRYMPPITFVEDDIPQQDGASLRRVRALPRTVGLPLHVLTADIAELRTQLRALVRLFNPLRGDGQLQVTSYDGTTRQITCRYASGLEVAESLENIAGWQRCMVMLRARDPFWYDVEATSQTYTIGTNEAFFPLLPLHINSDTIFGIQAIDNDGDGDAYPIWTVHGPATSIQLINNTTGEMIDLPVALTNAQSVTIDSRPYRRTVRRDDGTNLYGQLTETSSLWWLPTGSSNVQVTMPGATADSYVTLTYLRRWLTT